MTTYLIFFESEIITSSDIWFNYFHKESVIENKLYCSFLEKERMELGQDIQKSLTTKLPDCEVFEFGKMILSLEREFTVFFIVFSTNEILSDNINGSFYPHYNIEELKKKIFEIRDSLSQSINIQVVKRFVSNIFLPDKLKDIFRRIIEKSTKNELSITENSLKVYYQNYMRFPFLIEFQSNLTLNFEEEFNKVLNEYYTILSPLINEAGSLFAFEFSFCELKLYSFEKFDRHGVANLISKSFLDYIFSLYIRINDNLTSYRKRIERLSNKIKQLPGKVLIELNEQLIELKRSVFEEYPFLFISVLDRYILYKEDIENPDLTNQLFWNKDSQILVFRRNLQLLNEKIANVQAEIKILLLNIRDRITSFKEDDLKDRLKSIKDEKVFREEILIPILKDLGYENIQEVHGQHEYGIDLLFSNTNKFGIIEWNGIVAKIRNINLRIGTEISQKLKNLFDQIYQAKCMNHLEKNYGNVKLTRVFVVTNGKINFHGENILSKIDPLIQGNIFFVDIDTFLSLF